MNHSFFRREILTCRKCPRLVRWRESVAKNKVKRYADWDYWGKPVPGFGDKNARLWVIGLAPGAHGANRTGQMFTGDNSGLWLYKALHRFGFASKPVSLSRDDGLELFDCYISSLCRCAPPENKPTLKEIQNCSPFLERESSLLKNKKVIIALGRLAYSSVCTLLGKHPSAQRFAKFSHGLAFHSETLHVVSSYHPSQQNTFTGRLTETMFHAVFKTATLILSN